MGLVRDWLDWQESLGSGTANFLQEFQTELMKMSCSVYRKYPTVYTLTPFVKGLMGGYCRDVDEPLPDSPQSDFDGGNCPGIQYHVVYNRIQDVPGIGLSITGPLISNLNGPISTDAPFTNLRLFYAGVEQFERIGGKLGFGKVDTNVIEAYIDGATIKNHLFLTSVTWGYGFFSFEPKDGSTENCPNIAVDPADLTRDVTINNYNNQGDVESSNDYTLTIPFISNDFNLNVDVGGVNVGIDIGGIEIGGDVTVNLGGTGGGNPALPSAEDPPFSEDDLETFVPPGKEDTEDPVEEEEAESEEIKYVLIDIVVAPDNGKALLMPSASDSTFFAGYFSWTISANSGTYRLPEQPIRKSKSAFRAPGEALGYRFYTVNNAQLRATVYRQKIETNQE